MFDCNIEQLILQQIVFTTNEHSIVNCLFV